MNYHFFATLSRMKYIERWALMRNARHETLSEHALEVAMIAHGLCIIGNTRYGRHLNAERRRWSPFITTRPRSSPGTCRRR